MSFATLTDQPAGKTSAPAPAKPDAGFQPAHLYLLLSMAAATAAVVMSKNTHPVALLLISGSALAAGLVAMTLHRALSALLSTGGPKAAPMGERARDVLVREKALALQAIKELEFDRSMGKIGDADFAIVSGNLRARALSLMDDLEKSQGPKVPTSEGPVPARPAGECASCGTANDADAKFCKQCGRGLA